MNVCDHIVKRLAGDAPKVEEIAKIISAKVFGWNNLENLASKEQKEACTQAAMEIIEKLRPYFPTASQTPEKWPDYLPPTGMGAVAAIMNLWLREFRSSPTAEQIRDAAKIIDSLLATPASTARKWTDALGDYRNDLARDLTCPEGAAFKAGFLAAAPGSVPQAPKCSEPRVVELNPPNAPDKYAVFIGKVFIWEFDFEKEAEELRDNLKRVGVPQAEPPK